MKRVLALTGLSLALACASLKRVDAGAEDWHGYRRTRTATTLERRLAAAQAYLDRSPRGAWHAEVRDWFVPAEDAYYESSHRSAAQLRAYLDTLPHGPHARQALGRLEELELSARYAARRDERLTEDARELEEKLADAQRLRHELLVTLAVWTRRLAEIRSWGRPTSELDHELIFQFRQELPRGRCVDSVCRKAMKFPYAVPDGGKLRARSAIFDVVIELDRGGVARARIAGPELFSRVGEAALVAPIVPDDAQARAEGIARVVMIVQNAIEQRLPSGRCAGEAVGSVVLRRECDGVSLRVIAAASPEEDDRIEIEPLTPAAEHTSRARP